jgi:hypothetical protein
MVKGSTLQNIWESKTRVENGSTFKFKSAVWGPTLVEGLNLFTKYFLKKIIFVPLNLNPCHFKRKKIKNKAIIKLLFV